MPAFRLIVGSDGAVHQRDVAAHVFDVEEHLLLGKDLRRWLLLVESARFLIR